MSGMVKNERRTSVVPQASSAATAAEERDLEDWARRLVNRPTPQIGGGGPPQGTLNNFLNIANPNVRTIPVGLDGLPQHNGYDIDSALERFTWHTIADDKYVPCLFRCKEKFCALKMAEISVIGEFLRHLPLELYECIKLASYSVTVPEARLLNHINTWHCDGFYGAEQFTIKDYLIKVEDIERFYYFLNFAFFVLSSGGRNATKDYSKCAFIKVNADNLIPYTVLPNDEKGVPLFYFEGQTDILKEKAVPLKGWELAYLKVCCKVQGVRKDLIAGSTLQIVKVSDLRSYFPKRTIFTEQCWPEPKMKSLLSKSSSTAVVGGGYGNNPLPQSDKWIQVAPYVNSAAPPSNCRKGTTPVAHTPPAPPPAPIVPTTTTSTTFNVSIMSNNSISQQATSVIGGGMRNNTSASSSSAATSNNHHSSSSNTSVAVRVANGTPNIPVRLQANSVDLRKIKVLSPPQESSRLQPIPEFQDSNRENAYSIRLMMIDRELMHCINMHPCKTDTYLVVLQEFMNSFFPSVSIYPTAVSVLKSCGVATFLPNRAQMKCLNSFGFCIQYPWQMPLIQAVGVTQAMAKLRNVFRPRDAAANSIQNNSRSNGYTYNTNSRTIR